MNNIYLLAQNNIDQLQDLYAGYDDHFNLVAAPRIRLFLKMKEIINNNHLLWTIKYSPVNKPENEIRASVVDPNKKFHFYFAIPLSQKFELKLFLGDNTFNFFEAHPFLIQKEIIKKDEFNVSATLNTLPHLILSDKIQRIDRTLLESEVKMESVKESELFLLIETMIKRFTPSLVKIVNNEWAF